MCGCEEVTLAAGDDLERMQKQFYGVTRPGYRRLDVRVAEAK
jgi:hypothetical protein